MTASSFNLRGIPHQVMVTLKLEAKKNNMSVNSLIIKMIEQGVGFGSKPKRVVHHDLDFLIGSWSSQESKEFDKSIEIFEKIDEELWK